MFLTDSAHGLLPLTGSSSRSTQLHNTTACLSIHCQSATTTVMQPTAGTRKTFTQSLPIFVGIITSTKEVMFLSLFVCLLATLRKNFQTDLHEVFREGWQWANEQMIKFWWRSGSRIRNCMDLDPCPYPYYDTGKTCLGGSMHCPSTSSSSFI